MVKSEQIIGTNNIKAGGRNIIHATAVTNKELQT